MPVAITKETVQKFDIPGPRYTSYPTAPNWSEEVDENLYIEKLHQFGQSNKTLSLYIHIPFCRTLCSFCACNVVIRQNDPKYGDEYLRYLFREIELVAQYIGRRVTIRQLHWGGGTPTFLTEVQIQALYQKIDKHFDIDPQGEISIEIDPRTVTHEKIRILKSLGFNRISMGVQDFDETVQQKVNRIQPFEMVERVNTWCREFDFQSINFDLIYGLPDQMPEKFRETINQVIGLKPDRIALYSFAYVPWLKRHQQKIVTEELPSSDQKLEIFLNAREQFLDHGYQAIAMDHFALTQDELAQSYNTGRLYRNFMGYTTKPADEFIGMGLTSIGFLENIFIQNYKTLKDYYGLLEKNQLPVERGKLLSEDDRIRQWSIHSLMCHFHLDKNVFCKMFNRDFDDYFQRERDHLRKCENDGLLVDDSDHITVTELGRIFIRNICMGLDAYLKKGSTQRFSRTV